MLKLVSLDCRLPWMINSWQYFPLITNTCLKNIRELLPWHTSDAFLCLGHMLNSFSFILWFNSVPRKLYAFWDLLMMQRIFSEKNTLLFIDGYYLRWKDTPNQIKLLAGYTPSLPPHPPPSPTHQTITKNIRSYWRCIYSSKDLPTCYHFLVLLCSKYIFDSN